MVGLISSLLETDKPRRSLTAGLNDREPFGLAVRTARPRRLKSPTTKLVRKTRRAFIVGVGVLERQVLETAAGEVLGIRYTRPCRRSFAK